MFHFLLGHGDLELGLGFSETLVVRSVKEVLRETAAKIGATIHDKGAKVLVCFTDDDVRVLLKVSDKGLLHSGKVGLVSVQGLLETVVVAGNGSGSGCLEVCESCFQTW